MLATRRSRIEKLLIAMRNLVCLLVLVIISCQDKENDTRLKEMDFTISKPSWSQSKTFPNDIFMSFDENMKIT